MSAAYTVTQQTRLSRGAAITGMILLVALAAAPAWAGRADMRLLSEIYTYMALACLWNLLAGYTGLVSVGQQAYVGFGGYMLFALVIMAGVGPLWTIPIAGVLGAVIAVPVAVLIFRLKGAYFAIGTWVVAEVFLLLFAQIKTLGAGSGISLPVNAVRDIASGRDLREWIVYWVSLALVIAVFAFVYGLMSTRRGLALTAIRDSEVASESLGVNIWWTKFYVYVATAAATSMVGALIFLQKLRISPDAAFSVNDWTAYVIFITVIGGIGSIEGPIVGTVIFFLLREFLADLGSIYLMVLGLVAIVVMLKAPRGIWGLVADRYDISLFPVRRRVFLEENVDAGERRQ